MSFKQRMLDVIQGQTVDRIPWVPRLDLWYRANKKAGTLPEKHKNASLFEIVKAENMGFHAVIPNFRDLRSPEDDLHRALGIYNLHMMPYKTVLHNVDITVKREGDRTHVRYTTPVGEITTTVLFDDKMRESGITITHIEEQAITGQDDYEPLGYIFRNMEVLPNYEGYQKFASQIGPQGIAVGFASLAGSPMHLIQRELMYLETFFFEMHDHPEKLKNLAKDIGIYWDRMLDVIKKSPAEVILIGANYDHSVTYPPFFKEYIEPWLKKWSDTLHRHSKYLLTHTDGENKGLLNHYLRSGIDVADSICPEPMTSLSFQEVRDAFGEEIVIMGGIPSLAFLPDSFSDQEFKEFIDDFFSQIGDGRNLILGISDTTPPAADFNRILYVRDRINEMDKPF